MLKKQKQKIVETEQFGDVVVDLLINQADGQSVLMLTVDNEQGEFYHLIPVHNKEYEVVDFEGGELLFSNDAFEYIEEQHIEQIIMRG